MKGSFNIFYATNPNSKEVSDKSLEFDDIFAVKFRHLFYLLGKEQLYVATPDCDESSYHLWTIEDSDVQVFDFFMQKGIDLRNQICFVEDRQFVLCAFDQNQ